MEAASLPAALPDASSPLGAAPLESAQTFAHRLALGLAAGLIAVLVHGEATRLATEELTWRALLGR